VPFCQLGGRALVEGVGELLTPLPFVERPVTLLMPEFGVSTAKVYQAFDEMFNGAKRPQGVNHLEAPACRVQARLATLLDWARAEFGDVQLAGSGSTVFLKGHLFDTPYGEVASPAGTVKWCQTVATPAA
jgi:4-diphosphocytidyl-2-C-methyl-D-erythritol kinase